MDGRLIQAHVTFKEGGDPDSAKRTFLAIVDRGGAGAATALVGTVHTQGTEAAGVSNDARQCRCLTKTLTADPPT